MKVKELMDYLRENWATIREQLEQGTYKPQPVKRVEIPKPSGGKLHRYPDPPQAAWRCYPLEEIVAEKLRALLQSRLRLQERGWGTSRVCRDYYDLWHLLSRGTLDVTLLPELLAHKCALRQVTFASVADFLAPELQAVARVEWEHQLLPFVPDAPSADHVLDELIGLLAALPKACPSPGWPTD